MGGYYTLAEIEQVLDHYAATAPSLVGPKVQIGASVENRPIWAVKVSDNPGVSEAEPRILIDALHHAREPTSVQTLIYLLDELVARYGGDPEITALLDAREVWLVPVVNPDGYAYNEAQKPGGGGLWRKNRRPVAPGCFGVDLNRNYAFQWGIDDVGSSPDPCSESYRGPSPFSEPETAAMDQFVAQQGFTTVVSLHAHGRKLLYPFGYTVAPAPAGYAEHAQDLVAHNGYLAGTIQSMFGIANGNAIDHHHAIHGARAWAFELGGEFWPPIPEMIETAEDNASALLDLVRYAGSFVRAGSAGVAEFAGDMDGFLDPGEKADVVVELENRGVLATSRGGIVTLSTQDPWLTVTSATASFPALAPFAGFALPKGALQFAVAPGTPPGHRASLELTVSFDGLVSVHSIFADVGEPRRILFDDVESDLGWSLEDPTDDAFTGRWVRDDPIGVTQDGEAAQPEDDATAAPGKRCFVTGNQGSVPGLDDVDDGKTTLTSPAFDLSDAVEPRLRYRRFYWCSAVDDPLEIAISGDGGQNYVPLEVVKGRPNEWTLREWRVADFVPPGDRMVLRVVARDPTNNSVTEALLDDFEVVDFGGGPHVSVMGRVAPGAALELQLAAPNGGPLWILAAPASGVAVLPGVEGELLLDPASLLLVASVPAAPGDFVRLAATVPPDPALVGATAWLQALDVPGLVFSNATSATILPP